MQPGPGQEENLGRYVSREVDIVNLFFDDSCGDAEGDAGDAGGDIMAMM